MVDYRNALKIDFTGMINGFESFPGFNEDVCEIIRQKNHNVLIVIDHAIKMHANEPVCVTDHINLSGFNPLIGPNHESGERFPVMNNIYLTNGLPKIIAAGLKTGIVPSEEEFCLINTWGVSALCYNLIPTAIIAAHAGYKILGVLTPENKESIDKLNQYLLSLK